MMSARLAAIGAAACVVFAHAAPACDTRGTPAERLICADPALRRADARMNADYAVVRAAARLKHLDQDLLAGQRAWLASRDRGCAAAACLAARIAARGDILAALAARVSERNPTLFDLTAVWLDGRWTAGSIAPPGLAPAAGLEPPGATLTAGAGRFCDGPAAADCAAAALEPQTGTLASGPGQQDLPAMLGVLAGTPVYTFVRGNGDGYSLVAAPDGRLIVFAPACAAGGSPCGFAHQAWEPAGAGGHLRSGRAGFAPSTNSG